MEKREHKVPFPQADDFEKVIKILNVEQEDKLKDKQYLSRQIDMVTGRQVQYYMSACMYLGLVDENKRFTDLGHALREYNSTEQKIELIRILMADKVFGKTYIVQRMYDIKLTNDDIVEIMKENNVRFNSDAVYKRRAGTVSSWADWINKTLS